MNRRVLVARLAPFVIGLMIMVGALLVLVDPTPTCRGQLMRQGSTCTKTDGTQTQSYDQRIAAARVGGWVMLGTGGAVMVFGAVVVLLSRRRVMVDG